MKEDSLSLSNSMDIGSSDSAFVSVPYGSERYLSPNQQIEQTSKYNEMDFRRIQGGKKKQPDYIVVFKKYGEIYKMKVAQLASKQFGEATGKPLPIVIIDEDRCLETEKSYYNGNEKDGNKKNVTINELEQCFVETEPEQREEVVRKFKSFYKALNEKKKEALKKKNEKEKSENSEEISR